MSSVPKSSSSQVISQEEQSIYPFLLINYYLCNIESGLRRSIRPIKPSNYYTENFEDPQKVNYFIQTKRLLNVIIMLDWQKISIKITK